MSLFECPEKRNDRKPRFIEIKTFRFSGHSKSDKREYIPAKEDEYWHEHDPLIKLGNQMPIDCRKTSEDQVDAILEEALEKIEQRGREHVV